MKMKNNHLLLLVIALLLSLVTSCGNNHGSFRLEGRLRNMNMGEFWVYSPDRGINGIDTIKVRNGRFSYETTLPGDEATLVVIFPNYSEQPVIAKSGQKVSVKGDATHLKEIIIEGTTENEDLTILRMKLNDLTPPDIPGAVSDFITEHPQSLCSVYLLNRYFVNTPHPNFRTAQKLAKTLLKAQPDNLQLVALDKQLRRLQGGHIKSKLPKFTAKDTKGNKVTENSLKAKANVVAAWATWSYRSTSMQQKLMQLKKEHGSQLSVVGVCLDGSVRLCRERIQRDSIKWPTICDGTMWDTPLLSKFGMGDVPSNVVIDGKGVIVARNLSNEKLEETIKKLIN